VHAELVISDEGPGIPPQERRFVFERFFRSASARAMPGSGLGLAIVKQVVLKHGGALRVEYAVPGGKPPGTAIHIVLPGRPMPGETGRHAVASVDLPVVRADNG
jgi:two-component system sensor histidine kinase MprB